jgi:alpha-1,6-mannosyltransferase
MSCRAHTVNSARRATLLLGTMAVGLSALTTLAPSLHRQFGGWILIAVFAAAAGGAHAGARLAGMAEQRSALFIILAGAATMRAALLLVEPYLSSDIYRYVWDGRVQGAGINPYRYLPSAPELAQLRDRVIFPAINRAAYAPTIYPPVAQWFFLAVTRVSESVLAMKLGLLAFEAVILASLAGLLRLQGAPATRIAIYAWHPLPIWEIAGNGHVDAAMVALLMLALLLQARSRPFVSGMAVALGGLIKPTALLALPVLWRPWDWRLPLVVIATLLLAYLPYVSLGWGVFGFLPDYLQEEGFTTGEGYKLLWLLQSLTGPLPHAGAVYIAIAVLLLVSLSLKAAFRSDRSQAATLRSLNWLLVAFLVLSSPHYPWYFLVLVPFLALHPTATAWVLTVGSVFFYDAVPEVGALPNYHVRVVFFTLLLLATLAYDIWSDHHKPSAVPIGERP